MTKQQTQKRRARLRRYYRPMVRDCAKCVGTGEGMHEGTICHKCHGSGTIPIKE